MLRLLLGRSGYGKTEYVFKSIKQLVNSGRDNILLLIPEQYSFLSEKRLLTDLGESGVAKVESASFSRICDMANKIYGGVSVPVLSKGAKAVLMMKAIDDARDELTLFNKKLDAVSFVNSMVKIYDEMRSCNLNSDEINARLDGIENITLKRKMGDISKIMSCYEKLIDGSFLDPANELTVLYNKICDKNYFSGKTVFIDGFNGFVAQEYKILELVIKEADTVTVTLCTDSYGSKNKYDLFAYVNDSAAILEKIAKKAGVKCEIISLNKNYRAKNSDMLMLEKHIFVDPPAPEEPKGDNILIYSAQSVYDECCEASRKIRALLRKGYKASDIAVITRDINKYRAELSSAFKKYEIPFFYDERQPINCQPLVVFIEYLMRAVNFSFKSDDILSLAKTGLTAVSDDDINALENYVYIWNINGLKWTDPFENSTKGFVAQLDDKDKKALDKINKSREKLISPIVKFKKAVKKANAKKICEAIYKTLIDFKADAGIRNYALSLNKAGHITAANQQNTVWDMVMSILSEMPQTLGDDEISLKEFAGYFSLIISTMDLGSLPSGIDNVQFGQADRIRTDNPRAVFILGANEGEFPMSVTGGGLLSENDRKILLNNDFKLYSYGDILNLQERYFAYMACSAPSEKLFVSYRYSASDSGSPSEIITSIKNIFAINEYTYQDIKPVDLVETKQSAFELMSERFLLTDPFSSSLKKYFSGDAKYMSIKSLAENTSVTIKNKDLAKSLFGNDMYISASRVEDFYNCPFRYFCKFGLGARPRRKAQIDQMQRGTVIHYVLENILSDYGSKGLSQMSGDQIRSAVDTFVERYFKTQMGNVTDLSLRFKYNYRRLSKLIYAVVEHLAAEFSESDFVAEAFELEIDRDGRVKPQIIKLDDGGSVSIRGSIDRVDSFVKDSKRYVRVVDYKSGSKVFKLSDIMYGLNLQMFIYLFSLSDDKKSQFTGIPAGVLYMHSARKVFNYDSKKEAQNSLNKSEDSSFKMQGLVLCDNDEEVIRAMEHDLSGKFIPVKVSKNGDVSGSLASLEEMGKIHKKINSLIIQMAMDLHSGNIARSPVKNTTHKHTCEYCDYSDVCAIAKNIDDRITGDLTDNEVIALLDKEYPENAKVDETTE